MTLRSELTTRNIKDISVLLKRVVSTIYEDLGCRPLNVPLPLKIPGNNRLLWLETDVIEWFEGCWQKPENGQRSRA
jgi:predicted DNA-binding transcriptional regulator AlpA